MDFNSQHGCPLLIDVARKYRDEPRPRQGLLRTREFLMKDLYTFDISEERALQTYEAVKHAYYEFFNELKLPFLVAKADSGNIGGELSHEFHFPSAKGEDVVFSCSKCDFLINDELVGPRWHADPDSQKSHDENCNFGSPDNLARAQLILESYSETPGKSTLDGNIDSVGCKIWHGVTTDRATLIQAVFPHMEKVTNLAGTFSHWRESQLCTNSIRRLLPDVDLSVDKPVVAFNRFTMDINATEGTTMKSSTPRYLLQVVDHRVSKDALRRLKDVAQGSDGSERYIPQADDNVETHRIDAQQGIVQIEAGDPCPNCHEGAVKKTRAIELGHTFHLGTRYSEPLDACFIPSHQSSGSEGSTTSQDTNSTTISTSFETDNSKASHQQPGIPVPQKMPVQMGCHGIGVSRMIAAVADMLADNKGLNWPRVIAPFEVVVIPKDEHLTQAADVANNLRSSPPENANSEDANQEMPLDVIVDDRQQSFVWKLNDADLIGYPVIVVLGRRYGHEKVCEIQCRRLGIRDNVPFNGLKSRVEELLRQL